MRSLVIAAPSSGNGKTTFALGVLRALKKRGMDICGFKAGPDYIDRAFLEKASGLPAGNLDIHLQSEKGLQYSLSQAPAKNCIIEGVMGYFDGIRNTSQNSTHHLTRLLGLKAVLVYTPKGEAFTAIPKIKGLVDFGNSSIAGIVFNRVSYDFYVLLKDAVEKHMAVKVLGYMPKLPEIALKSRHLGLIQSIEIENLERIIETAANAIERHVEMQALIDLMTETKMAEISPFEHTLPTAKPVVAVAKDEAFSFHYRENIALLEKYAHVKTFSPMHDSHLPACDLLYLVGGYPEIHYKALAENRGMLKSIREYGEDEGYIFAECGGLMYLSESIENRPMVGLFRGSSRLTDRLQRFGYVNVVLNGDCFLGEKGDELTAHEFHKSLSDIRAPKLFDIIKTGGTKRWQCGYRYKNAIAGYPHFNFVGNMKMFRSMLKSVVE